MLCEPEKKFTQMPCKFTSGCIKASRDNRNGIKCLAIMSCFGQTYRHNESKGAAIDNLSAFAAYSRSTELLSSNKKVMRGYLSSE